MAFTGEFAIDLVEDALIALLTAQLVDVDVAATAAKDFDDNGNLILNPPSVRTQFAGETASSFENQHLNYDVDQNYLVLCLDQDLGPVAQVQRTKSAQLLGTVKHLLIGARLALADGSVSEPVRYVQADPLPVEGIGTAFVAMFAVGGIANFAGVNA